MFDDLDDAVTGSGIREETTTPKKSFQPKAKKQWEAEIEHEPKKINPDTMGRKSKTYAISGEEPPASLVDVFTALLGGMESKGFTLNALNGETQGLEPVILQGVEVTVDLYSPWTGFNKTTEVKCDTPLADAYSIVTGFIKTFGTFKPGGRAFMARRVHQILGHDLKTPIEFLAVYTADGAEKANEVTRSTGNTGIAIQIATGAGIPVFNLHKADGVDRLKNFIKTLT